MSAIELKAHCATCAAKRACMHTFGAYWHAKSGGGNGCTLPMTAEHARAVERVLDAQAAKEAESAQADLFTARQEAESAFAPREWVVSHKCRDYETTAKTQAQAINNVRFKLYGTRPASCLAPFSAHPKPCGTMTNVEAARRLARFAARSA